MDNMLWAVDSPGEPNSPLGPQARREPAEASSRSRAWLVRLRRALTRKPAPANRTPYENGVALLESGRPREALAAFDEALLVAGDGPARAVAHNKRGVAHIALARPDEAIAEFCSALECDKRCAPALVNMGNLSLENGRVEEAIEYYETALRADERSAAAHRHLGIAYKRLGRHADAVRHLRTAMRLEIRLPWQRSRT